MFKVFKLGKYRVQLCTGSPIMGLVEIIDLSKKDLSHYVFHSRRFLHSLPILKGYYKKKAERLAREMFQCEIKDAWNDH